MAGKQVKPEPPAPRRAVPAKRKQSKSEPVAPAEPSKRKPSVAKKQSFKDKGPWDCFLTHDWAKDELKRNNHQRVSMLKEALEARGYKTWFDEEMMTGNIERKMMEGIDGSRTIICFVTDRYCEKANGDGERGDDDNCKFELDYALKRKGAAAIYPVVMEPRMRDTGNWSGIVLGKLGGKLYADFSEDDKLESAVDTIDRFLQDFSSKGEAKGEVRA